MSSCSRGGDPHDLAAPSSTRMFEPTASATSIDSVFLSPQLRARNSYGFELRAPTGHRSMMLPCSSEVSARLDPVGDFHMLAAVDGAQFLHRQPLRPGSGCSACNGCSGSCGWKRAVRSSLLGTGRLFSLNREWSWTVKERDVLQIALAALVADRAFEGMIDQQEFEDTASLALWTIGVSVLITIPSAAGIAQEAIGFGDFSISTRHMRQLPAMFSRGW